MGTNTIHYIYRRVSSLSSSSEVAGVVNGERFFAEDDGNIYYKKPNGDILISSILPTYVAKTAGLVGGTPPYLDVQFNSSVTMFYFVAMYTKLRLKLETDIPSSVKIRIHGNQYDIISANGTPVVGGSIKANTLVELLYDGTAFRVIAAGGSGSPGVTTDENGNTIITGDLIVKPDSSGNGGNIKLNKGVIVDFPSPTTDGQTVTLPILTDSILGDYIRCKKTRISGVVKQYIEILQEVQAPLFTQTGTQGTAAGSLTRKDYVDTQSSYKTVTINKPSGAVDTLYYPIVVTITSSLLGRNSIELALSTNSGAANLASNNCSFFGYINSAGSKDTGRHVNGAFHQFDTAERSLHSIHLPKTASDLIVYYVRGDAFPCLVSIDKNIASSAIVAYATDLNITGGIIKAGVADPSKNGASTAIDIAVNFDKGNGNYCTDNGFFNGRVTANEYIATGAQSSDPNALVKMDTHNKDIKKLSSRSLALIIALG